jgi:hypothetical protein
MKGSEQIVGEHESARKRKEGEGYCHFGQKIDHSGTKERIKAGTFYFEF